MSAERPELLVRAATRGAAWAFLSTALARTISLLALVVLARLLTPQDFGTVALALLFITFAETVGDLGTGAALIYWPREREGAARAAFRVSFAMGWLWWLLAQVAAPWLADFFHNPQSETVLRVLAFTFPLKGLGSTHDALCQKDLRFRARLIPEVMLFSGKAGVSIALAVAGYGVWSLVGGQLAGTLLWVVALWAVVPWRPWGGPSRKYLLPLLRYGRSIVAVKIIATVVHHADLVVVGRMLGAETLGLYQVAQKVPEITIAVLIWVAGKVLFPTFSRLQASRKALRRFYLKALQYVSALALPAAAALALLAEPLVLVAFGEQWRPAGRILQAIAVYMGLRALGSHAGDVLKGIGRPGLLASLGLVKAALLLPAILWAGRSGAVQVAWAMALVSTVTVSLNFWIVGRLLGFSLTSVLESLRPSVVPTAAMSAVLILWLRLAAQLPPALVLSVAVPLGLTVYALTLWVTSPAIFQDARDHLMPTRLGVGSARNPSVSGVAGP